MTLSPIENTVRFGLFELDLRTWQLTKNGVKIRLPLQSIQALSLLLERPGEIVTRIEVNSSNASGRPMFLLISIASGLNKSIQKLRDALGDSGRLSPVFRRNDSRVSDTVSSGQPTGRQKSGNSKIRSTEFSTAAESCFRSSSRGSAGSRRARWRFDRRLYRARALVMLAAGWLTRWRLRASEPVQSIVGCGFPLTICPEMILSGVLCRRHDRRTDHDAGQELDHFALSPELPSCNTRELAAPCRR